jgi:hypothetical protein
MISVRGGVEGGEGADDIEISVDPSAVATASSDA